MAIFRFLIMVISSLLFTAPAWSASLLLSDKLIPGSAVLLQVKDIPRGATLIGDLDNRKFPITEDGLALVALDMETKTGQKTIRVKIANKNGTKETVSKKIWVEARKYEEEHITLPKKKVDLDKKDLTRAGKETKAIKATYRLRGGKVGYVGEFKQAVSGRFSGIFGSRRVLNGKPRRPHSGVDIAAPKGTPIITTAPGRVALTGDDYFFTGNTVVIHHGDGVVSLYSHMDEILVAQDDWIPEGTVIGTIGMTGRATGPHLHWGVLVRGARVDPMLLPGIRQQ